MPSSTSLFVSHGAPNLVIDDIPATAFLKDFGEGLARPKAILVISAHFEAGGALVSADADPEMIYDFRGFEPELHELCYDAPGWPELSEQVAELLNRAGIEAGLAHDRGFDHGTWVPLMLLFPSADVPVVQLSVSPGRGARHHYRIGEALRSLGDEGVLIIGSGSLTHNLGEFFRGGYEKASPAPDWVDTFATWMHDRVASGDVDSLLDYRAQAPYAEKNHPTEEHLLPFFVAAGAATSGGKAGRRIHRSNTYGVLAMDAYAFQ